MLYLFSEDPVQDFFNCMQNLWFRNVKDVPNFLSTLYILQAVDGLHFTIGCFQIIYLI